MTSRLIDVQDLRLSFPSPDGDLQVLRGVNLHIDKGEIVGLVGESGSGKSLTSLSIIGLLPKPYRGLSGRITYREGDLMAMPESTLRGLRGNSISMIFQEPMTSLNPVYTVGKQITEAIRTHEDVSREDAWGRAVELLRKVGVPAPGDRVKNFPHQLSGGMRQRVMIAMALSCSPELLIADEPTTALDVTIQAQILDLIVNLRRQTGMSVLLITHALGVVAETADRVAVMYAGNIVESASTAELFDHPTHPYTLGLLSSIPRIDKSVDTLHTIPGMVPSPRELGQGCAFAGRCVLAADICFGSEPELTEHAPGHFSRCWRTQR